MPKLSAPRELVFSLLIALAALIIPWALVVELGTGTYQFWLWDSQSGQTTATLFTGVMLSLFAFWSWRTAYQQRVIEARQDSLRFNPTLFSYNFTLKPQRKQRLVVVLTDGGMRKELADAYFWDIGIVNFGEAPVALETLSLHLEIGNCDIPLPSTTCPLYILYDEGEGRYEVDRLLVTPCVFLPGQQILLGIFLARPDGLQIPIGKGSLSLKMQYRTPGGSKILEYISAKFGTGPIFVV